MRKVFICFLAIVTLLPAAAEKSKPGKQPEVIIKELRIVREEGLILIDSTLVVNRENPIRGLVVMFDLLAPGGHLISKQVTTASENDLEYGESVTLYLQCVDHVRAVSVRVLCREDRGPRLRLDKPGPYQIE